MIRSIGTEIASFISGGLIAGSIPILVQEGIGASAHFLLAFLFGCVCFYLIYRMTRHKIVALVLTGLNVAYWTGLIAVGLGAAYIFVGGVREWSVELVLYVASGALVAVFAWRGRAAFDKKADNFPVI